MRYGLRVLRRSPGLTISAVLTLALGIGANTAIFSLVNAILLRQLPFEHAARLVWVWSTRTDRDRAFYSLPDFIETRRSIKTLDGMGGYANWGASFTGLGEPERFVGARVVANSFELMGVRPLYGRLISPGDGSAGSERVVILSFGLWERRFGADPSLIGRKLILNGDSYRVIGVLPREFVMPATDAELFVPLVIETDPWRADRDTNFLRVFARLKPSATRQQAAAELAAVEKRLREMYPASNAKHGDPRVRFFREEVVGGYRAALWTIFGAVFLVLLIACFNLAGLLLVRASGRGREVAIRLSLGATRFQLIRQFMSEVVLLGALGGALGVLLAKVGLALVVSLDSSDLPRASEVTLDGRVLLFAVASTLLSVFMFGLAPAWQFSRADLGEALKERGGQARNAGLGSRSVCVVAEVALSIVLLSGAGLLLKTFLRLQAVSPGFSAGHLLLLRASLPKQSYNDAGAIRKFYDNLERGVTALPGAQSVAFGSVLPLSGMNTRSEFEISGRKPASPLDLPAAQNRWVSAGYFHTLGIPVKAGREFMQGDIESFEGVAVVDETCAAKYWPDRSPLGQKLRLQGREYKVVGVVGNVKHESLTEDPLATVYGPFTQVTPAGFPFLASGFSIVVRTAGDPLALATAVRGELRRVDANVAASSVRSMDQFVVAAVGQRRFNLELIGAFAAASLLLAMIGLYGVVSYSVTIRRGEIGLRMALGADGGSILRLIVGYGLRLVLAGIGVGLIGALVTARAARSLLIEANPADQAAFIAVALLFATAGAVAAYFPARRAMRAEPITVLRIE